MKGVSGRAGMHGEEERRAGDKEIICVCVREREKLHKRRVTAPTSLREGVAPGYRNKQEARAPPPLLTCHSDIRVNESDRKYQMLNSLHFGICRRMKSV